MAQPKAAHRTLRQAKGTISEHIKHIFEDGELEEISVVRLFRTTATDGKIYEVSHYNLDMVLALGFRVRSTMDSWDAWFGVQGISTLRRRKSLPFTALLLGMVMVMVSAAAPFSLTSTGVTLVQPVRLVLHWPTWVVTDSDSSLRV